MKIWAASVSDESGHHWVFASLNEDGIGEQIRDLALGRYGQGRREEFESHYRDEYLDYEDYLMDQFRIEAEEEIDL